MRPAHRKIDLAGRCDSVAPFMIIGLPKEIKEQEYRVALLPSGSPRASFVDISAPGRISPVLGVLRIRASLRRCPQLARRELGVDLPVFEKAPLGRRFSRHWTGGWMLESVARSDELRSSVLSR